MEENRIVMRDFKTFCFNFDWPKDVDKNLNYEIELKRRKSVAENKINKKTEQLFPKYEHGKNIHEHRKQQNE